MRKAPSNQLSLFDEPAPPVPDPRVYQESENPSDYEHSLMIQIRRDVRVLLEDEVFQSPSRAFFEQRVAEYQAELKKVRAEKLLLFGAEQSQSPLNPNQT